MMHRVAPRHRVQGALQTRVYRTLFRVVRISFCAAAVSLAAWCAAEPTLLASPQDGPEDIAGLQAIRGSVVKVAGQVYFVKTPQGAIYKVATSVNTRFVRGEQGSSAAGIHPGDLVLAGGELDEKQHTLGAIFVAAVDAQQLEEFDRRRTEFGKTWLAGTIVGIAGTRITVKRPDDVVTVVTVDENTSFRRRHESITLGDIQVGDGLTARGEMNKGAFAGTLLTVVDAGEIREWSRLRDR
jgi:hypothetical protein